MATDWIECTLGDVIELKRGYDLPRGDRKPGVVPLVSSSGVSDHQGEVMVRGPGVVTGRYGTLGQVFFIEQDFWPLNTTLYVHDFKGNDPRFISYFLRSLDLGGYSDKAAVPGVNRNHLHREPVRVPSSKAEQRRIAHILGTLDDKIELNRRMNESLEEMARALFKSWFVDFEPVRAKAEGRDPGLPPHLADLFPDRLVDSELGEIPEGWKLGSLGEVLVESQERTRDLAIPEYSCTDRGVVPRSQRFTKQLSQSTSRNKLVRRGDFVFGISRRILNFGMMPGEVGGVSSAYRVYRVDTALIDPDQLETAIRMRHDYYYGAVSASSREGQSVSPEALRRLRVLIPPVELQESFRRVQERPLGRSRNAAVESAVLQELRDALLPRLLEGRWNGTLA